MTAADHANTVRVGQKWRSDLGGPPFVVIRGEPDGSMFFVLRSDQSKRRIKEGRGGYAVAPFEFDSWVLLEDTPDEDES